MDLYRSVALVFASLLAVVVSAGSPPEGVTRYPDGFFFSPNKSGVVIALESHFNISWQSQFESTSLYVYQFNSSLDDPATVVYNNEKHKWIVWNVGHIAHDHRNFSLPFQFNLRDSVANDGTGGVWSPWFYLSKEGAAANPSSSSANPRYTPTATSAFAGTAIARVTQAGSAGSTPTWTSQSDPGSNLSTGAKAGIGVGVGLGIILIALLVGIIVVFLRRRRQTAVQPATSPHGVSSMEESRLTKTSEPSTRNSSQPSEANPVTLGTAAVELHTHRSLEQAELPSTPIIELAHSPNARVELPGSPKRTFFTD
ncbi:MAG: hypothetical protein M1828_000251 [Chrysothrix sp. TS-e1954]|nr:MAG: hypothetical protein M1828_000251 [Chrysothrix sp. TS-e1954]